MTAISVTGVADPARLAEPPAIRPESGTPRGLPGATGHRRFLVVLAALLLVPFARADDFDTLRLKWFDTLVGTGYDIQDPAQANSYRWVHDSFEPIIDRGAAWDLVRGRLVPAPFRTSRPRCLMEVRASASSACACQANEK